MKHNILKQIEWPSLIFLTATPIAAIATGIWYFQTETFNPWMLAVFFFFYHATGMSVTAGYHRLFAHKAYEANKFVKALYLFFGAGAFQNSTRKWVIDHRIHHRYVDEEQDPYCINKGFWYAHFLWMCKKEDWRSTTMGNGYARDIDKDPMIVFQDKYYIPIASVSCFVVPALVGWAMGSWLGGLFFGGTLRLVVVHHCTFFVNSIAHYWGFRPYTDENTARDNAVLALFTYGEGYHNFHHIFHADYRNGIKWYHYDPTKWMIRFMAYFQIVRNLRVTPDYEIFKAKMGMMEKRLIRKQEMGPTKFETMLVNIKAKADEAYAKLVVLKKEYDSLKLSFDDNRKTQMRRLKHEIRMAKLEFRYACQHWRLCLQGVRVTA